MTICLMPCHWGGGGGVVQLKFSDSSHMMSVLDSHPDNAGRSLKTMDWDACFANLYSIMSILVSSVVLRLETGFPGIVLLICCFGVVAATIPIQ